MGFGEVGGRYGIGREGQMYSCTLKREAEAPQRGRPRERGDFRFAAKQKGRGKKQVET